MNARSILSFLVMSSIAVVCTRAQVTFAPAVDLGSASFQAFFASADIDHDGDLDFVRASSALTRFYRGNGDGTFEAPAAISMNQADARGLVLADLDADGFEDLILAGRGNLIVGWSDGSGSFSPSITVDNFSGARFSGIAVADFDGDGDQDIAVIAGTAGFVAGYRNLGNRNFASRTVLATLAPGLNSNTSSLAAVSLDGGLPALVCGVSADSTIIVIPNLTVSATGLVFGTPSVVESGVANPRDLHGVDLDGDGDLDVVRSSTSTTLPLAWLENVGGVLAVSHPIAYGLGVSNFAMADIDGDGDDDIVANGSSTAAFIERTSATTFAAAVTLPYSSTDGSADVLVGDFEGDGFPDVLVGGASQASTNFISNHGILPGTREDFELASSLNGESLPLRHHSAMPGDVLELTMYSPGGSYVGALDTILAAQIFTTGNRPNGSFPGVRLSIDVLPLPVIIFESIGFGPFGPIYLPMPEDGFTFSASLPAFTGMTVLFQALTIDPTAANGIFASSYATLVDGL